MPGALSNVRRKVYILSPFLLSLINISWCLLLAGSNIQLVIMFVILNLRQKEGESSNREGGVKLSIKPCSSHVESLP